MKSFKGIFDLTALREKYKTSGEGVKVAILDTGVDLTNTILKERVVAARDLCNPASTGQDTDGHGTLLAGIINSVAPSCDLLIGKIMLRSGFYTPDALSDGIRWSLRNGAEIICVATGDKFYDKETDENIRHAVLEKNVLLLAAIGNNGERSSHAGTYPARCKECIAVGAVNDHEMMAWFCDVNPTVQMLCAPGVEIESFDLNGKLVPGSGTSQATAYLTGVLALLVSGLKKRNKPIYSPDIKDALLKSALHKVSGEIEYKIVNPEALYKLLL